MNGVYSYLDCNTAHITQEDYQELKLVYRMRGAYEDHKIIIDKTDYGFWLYVPDNADMLNLGYLSTSLYHLFKKAHKYNCTWIKLDQDGIIHEDLKQYEWN